MEMESSAATFTSVSDKNDQNGTENQTSLISSSSVINILFVLAFIVGGLVSPAFLFLYGDRGPYDNTYPLFIPKDIAVIIALCVLGVIIPVASGFWTRRHTARKFSTESKTKDENNRRGTKLQRLRQNLRDGLYIELHKRPTIPQLMENAREYLSSFPPPAHQHDQHTDGRSDEASYDEEEEEMDHSLHKDRDIGPGCLAKESEIRSYYKSTNDNDNTDDKIVFVLRLALGLLATGHCTVDVETTVLKAAAVLKLASPRISVGHRLLQAQFGSAPPHLLTCKRDFVFSTLKDLQMLADAVIAGEIQQDEAHVAVEVLNRILDTPLPYGWIVYDLVFVGIGPWATVAAYYGSYWDMLGAICLSPVTVLTYRLCEKLKISHLEEILVPFTVGLFAPLVWRVCNGGQDLCHITPMYMGALLIHLPGAEIVWAIIEILQGSIIHGASRLIKGLIAATSLAVFLVLGWQVFGRDLASSWLLSGPTGEFLPFTEGSIASLPDSEWCADTFEKYYPDYMTWAFVVGVYNIPLNILCLANVYIPVRDWVGPFIVGQVGLLALGYLQFQCTPQTCELPAGIQNLLSAYAATWVALFVEVISGLPSPISVIPVLFIFAPGSSSVLAAIGGMHRDAGDLVRTNTASWDNLAFTAFTFGAGIFLAEQTWKPLMAARFDARRQNARKVKVDDNENVQDLETTVGEEMNASESLPFDFDEAFHSPQTVVHGNAYRDRVNVMQSFNTRRRKNVYLDKKAPLVGHSTSQRNVAGYVRSVTERT